MSFSSRPNQFRHHHHDMDDVRDYRVQYPHHAGHHHDVGEPHDYRDRRPNADPVLCDNYPYYASHPHTYDGRHVKTEVEPRRVHAVEYKAYEYAPAPGTKDDVGSEIADENIDEEAEQFIRMEHKKFSMIKWMSKTSG